MQVRDGLFPPFADVVPKILLSSGAVGLGFVIFFVWYWFSPKHLEVGYRPLQPIPFSHALHAGELGIDCRYCHHTVETAAHAAIPPTQTCMNCHNVIKKDSPAIKKIHESWSSQKPIAWTKVHMLPDFAYFSHAAHVTAGVSCVTCHGRVDAMDVVYQAQPLSMAWCLECHRNPDHNLRPKEFVTKMDWVDPDPLQTGQLLRQQRKINPKQDCSTCHR